MEKTIGEIIKDKEIEKRYENIKQAEKEWKQKIIDDCTRDINQQPKDNK